MSILISQFVPPFPSLAVSTNTFWISISALEIGPSVSFFEIPHIYIIYQELYLVLAKSTDNCYIRLFGIQNGCIVTRRDLRAIRLQMASVIWNTAGGVLGSGRAQSKFRFSVAFRDTSKTRSSVAAQLHFCKTDLWLITALHFSLSSESNV